MGLISRIKGWLLGACAVAIAALIFVVQWQARRIEDRDRKIRDANAAIDTSRRIDLAPKAKDAESAKQWLKDYADD